MKIKLHADGTTFLERPYRFLRGACEKKVFEKKKQKNIILLVSITKKILGKDDETVRKRCSRLYTVGSTWKASMDTFETSLALWSKSDLFLVVKFKF